MADSDDIRAEDSAEKAYAAAAEAITEKEPEVAPVAEPDPVIAAEPVEFPAKPKRARKPREVAPVAEMPVVVAAAPAPKPKVGRPRAAAAKPAKVAVKKAPPKTVAAVKPAAAKPVPAKPPVAAKSAPAKLRKPAAPKIKAAAKAAPKPVKAASKPVAAKPEKAGLAAPTSPFIAKLKELPMDVTSTIKDAVSGAQAKAKDAFTKTSAAATEATEFAKGNVEAMVESGKILASGLQDIGGKFLADSKSAFETATADVKALTAVKSPTDFFQMQTELLRRNIDTAVAYSSKTSEAMMKLTNEVMAPLSGRVNLAVEKIKKAA